MAVVSFKRGNQAFIDSLPIVDGQLIFNTETGEIFQDVGTERRMAGSSINTGDGTNDHRRLINRNLENQHPISAITDLQNALNKKIELKLAWTNASPKSNFAAQSINIDFSEYSAILLSYYTFGVNTGGAYDAYSEKESSMVFTGFGKKAIFTSQPFTGGYSIIKRSFELSKNSINFEDGFYCENSYNGIYSDNRLVIPLAIYGIKGVI